jgi:hypothetical protein
MNADREREIMPIVLLLDITAMSDLRQCDEKGFINRSRLKQWGVVLLEELGLIEKTQNHKRLCRYELTALGKEVAILLPSDGSLSSYIMEHTPLVYGSGQAVEYGKVASYRTVHDYRLAVWAFSKTIAGSYLV